MWNRDKESEGTGGPFKRLIERVRALGKPKDAPVPAAPAPDRAAEGAAGSAVAPRFSLDHLARRLYRSGDPAAALRDFATNVGNRIAAGEAVAPLEAFLAHALEDAGIDTTDMELPPLSVVRPPASGLFYVRVNAAEVPYLALLRVVGIEAALNAAQFIAANYGEAGPAAEAEAWQFAHRISSSITAQSVSALRYGEDEPQRDGEWAVRKAISLAIESFQLPWRLSARFRVNVRGGEVAIACDLTPAALMLKRTSIDGVRVVPTTPEMQRRSATDYNTRLALLIAAAAFESSPLIRSVWVAGTIDTAKHHSCLYSVRFDRSRFAKLDLARIKDPVAVLRSFDAALDEKDGMLAPVQQTFSLDDARFCPARRFEAPEVSARVLPEPFSTALGTAAVAGLGIDEGGHRVAIAREILRRMGESTEQNVRTIIELAGDDPDPSVRAAAERTVKKLIDGSIDEDAVAISDEFTGGDALSSAVARARALLVAQRAEDAEALLSQALAAEGSAYADSSSVVFRVFGSYVERVIYNRLGIDGGKTVLLAPTAYVEALLVDAFTLSMLGRHDEAIVRARAACIMSPVSAQSHFALVHCLEAASRTLEAVDELRSLLSVAHDAMGIGFGYYRMASFMWQLGEVKAAQACYLRALRFMPQVISLVAPELQIMAIQGEDRLDDISDEAIDALLAKQGVPLAPTPQISAIFFEGMRAALDAEIFPVAKNFLWVLGGISRDDVYFGVLRSLEDEPDA